MEKIFQNAREEAFNLKRVPSTYAEALFSNPPNFIKKVEEKSVPTKSLVLFIASEFEEGDGQSRDLLNKMIQAMKLTKEEFNLLEVDGKLSEFGPDEKKLKLEEIRNQILVEKPQVVVTLGASVSNLILEGQERLSKIHGNFFPRSFEGNFHTQIVPLFHPNFLLINPSMKKSAWMDMQKIMDFVGKPLA